MTKETGKSAAPEQPVVAETLPYREPAGLEAMLKSRKQRHTAQAKRAEQELKDQQHMADAIQAQLDKATANRG